MTLNRMEHILSLGALLVTKLSTDYREPISPEQRLSLTLSYLATGESQISISLQNCIERQAISKIIPETCKAVCDALVAKYVDTPSLQEDIALQFRSSLKIGGTCLIL